ncbi:MAG: 23S rRNA (uracil(1939)-C(5))-methyltransferase RlmD [Chlamydiales bacterium]|jgi:23S rRNA (uracil1939-C5)-methyltransferase|nr:23S rRNA (uracil(1939)-C(5))-methyltransferase RlmD [Chlamydiales bacterium]
MRERVCVIQRFHRKGYGAGNSPGFSKPLHVIGGVVGDELVVEIKTKQRAFIKQITCLSPYRAIPKCSHAPFCGGCSWQQVDYLFQLEQKQQRIHELFASFIKEGFSLKSILSCDQIWHYRNKMEFSFSQDRAGQQFLGLILAGSKGYVFNLQECWLVSAWFSSVVAQIRLWWKQSGLRAYRLDHTGSLRTLIVRQSLNTSDKLVMLTVSGRPEYALNKQQIQQFVQAILLTASASERISIFLRIQQTIKGQPTQFFEMHLHGPDHILERLMVDGKTLTFKISPTSFFQPNPRQAEKLFSFALQVVQGPKKHILDLYAGTATLSIVFAKIADRVTAIELNPHAVFDAKVNKELNHIENLEIICGDVGQKIQELKKDPGFILPDLVIVDPPRTGLDDKAIQSLLELRPQEILYISCNPITQAKDIQLLVQKRYQLMILQPVDQFPHTVHVETMALLRLF